MNSLFPQGLVRHGLGRKDNFTSRHDGSVASAPLGAGGSIHAGHTEWKTIIRPVLITDSMGIVKPSAYAYPGVKETEPMPSIHRPMSAHRVFKNRYFNPPSYTSTKPVPLPTPPPDDKQKGDGEPEGPTDPSVPNPSDPPTLEPDPSDQTGYNTLSWNDIPSTQLNVPLEHIDSALEATHKKVAETKELRRQLYDSKVPSFEVLGRLAAQIEELEAHAKTLEYNKNVSQARKALETGLEKEQSVRVEKLKKLVHSYTQTVGKVTPTDPLLAEQLAVAHQDLNVTTQIPFYDTLKKVMAETPENTSSEKWAESTATKVYQLINHESPLETVANLDTLYHNLTVTSASTPQDLLRNGLFLGNLLSKYEETFTPAKKLVQRIKEITSLEEMEDAQNELYSLYNVLQNKMYLKIQDSKVVGADFQPPSLKAYSGKRKIPVEDFVSSKRQKDKYY